MPNKDRSPMQSSSPPVVQASELPPLARLALWREAQAFAERVARLVVSMRRDVAADAIARQLVRAAGSVPANIAEGYGRYSQAAYRNHLSIARGSAFEAQSWLDLLMRRGYVEETL